MSITFKNKKSKINSLNTIFGYETDSQEFYFKCKVIDYNLVQDCIKDFIKEKFGFITTSIKLLNSKTEKDDLFYRCDTFKCFFNNTFYLAEVIYYYSQINKIK